MFAASADAASAGAAIASSGVAAGSEAGSGGRPMKLKPPVAGSSGAGAGGAGDMSSPENMPPAVVGGVAAGGGVAASAADMSMPANMVDPPPAGGGVAAGAVGVPVMPFGGALKKASIPKSTLVGRSKGGGVAGCGTTGAGAARAGGVAAGSAAGAGRDASSTIPPFCKRALAVSRSPPHSANACLHSRSEKVGMALRSALTCASGGPGEGIREPRERSDNRVQGARPRRCDLKKYY